MYRLVQDIAKSEQIKTTLTQTLSKGDGLLVGSVFGFLLEDGVSGDERVLVTRGTIVEVHATPRAWSAGEAVFDDNNPSQGPSNVTNTGTRNVGYVYESKDTTGATAGTDAAIIRIVFTGGN